MPQLLQRVAFYRQSRRRRQFCDSIHGAGGEFVQILSQRDQSHRIPEPGVRIFGFTSPVKPPQKLVCADCVNALGKTFARWALALKALNGSGRRYWPGG